MADDREFLTLARTKLAAEYRKQRALRRQVGMKLRFTTSNTPFRIIRLRGAVEYFQETVAESAASNE